MKPIVEDIKPGDRVIVTKNCYINKVNLLHKGGIVIAIRCGADNAYCAINFFEAVLGMNSLNGLLDSNTGWFVPTDYLIKLKQVKDWFKEY